MRYLNALPGVFFAVAGCVVMVYGVRDIAPDADRSSFSVLASGVLLFTFGSVLGTIAFLAPKYGTRVGRSYYFDTNSPIGPIIAFGILILVGELGLLLWTAH